MKYAMRYSAFLLPWMIGACALPNNVSLGNLNHPRYKYILDFESKIAQEKMRIGRSYYSGARMSIFLLDVLVTSTIANSSRTSNNFRYYEYDEHPDLPRLSKKIRIINQGQSTLYADLLTGLDLNHEFSCSVKKIVLPANRSITLITAYDEHYELLYSWEEDAINKKSFAFYPSSFKTLRVTEQGVNRTVVINNY